MQEFECKFWTIIQKMKMKFYDPQTIQAAVSPTFIARWVFGIGTIEYPFGRLRSTISLWWSVAHIVLILNLMRVTYSVTPLVKAVSNSIYITYRLITFCAMIFVVVDIILGRINSKNTMHCMHRIIAVNENFKRLGIPSDYGLTLKLHLLVLIGHLILVSGQIITDYLVLIIGYPSSAMVMGIAYWMLVHYELLFSSILDYNFCLSVRYINNRFRRLNAYLIKSALKENNNSKLLFEDFDQSLPGFRRRDVQLVEIGNEQWMVHILQETRAIHRSLCKIAERINNEFDIPILLSMIVSFCTMIALLYSMYNEFFSIPPRVEFGRTFRRSLSLILYATKILSIVYTCSTTTFEARRTGQLMYELLTPTSSQAIRDEIHTFSLQFLQSPLEFTANGFFTLDYGLICQMAGSVTTYLVILIQMQSSLAVDSMNPKLTMNSTG